MAAKNYAQVADNSTLLLDPVRLRTLSVTSEEILNDYRQAYRSRQVSLVGRREVVSGKAKFGIFGEGKEIVQLVMAKVFQPGDFRSGYYRDQTFMFAAGVVSVQQFFAQIYAHTDLQAEPATGGRLMVAHFATRSLNPDGSWKDLTEMPNSSADVSPTAAQMPRLVGLAYASRLYREVEELQPYKQFSDNGNEIAFGTIGNAATAEGIFWEAINAIGVLSAPAIITIYDDEYGISVPNQFQMVKGDLSEILKGFQRNEIFHCRGFDLYTVAGWDYPELVRAYRQSAKRAREEHVPAIVHVIELTQPQGHSTSGSHERYKPQERLEWELECDALKVFRESILESGIAADSELEKVELEENEYVENCRKAAWEDYQQPILQERQEMLDLLGRAAAQYQTAQPAIQNELEIIRQRLSGSASASGGAVILRRQLSRAIQAALMVTRFESADMRQPFIEWKEKLDRQEHERISSYLYDETAHSALRVPAVAAEYREDSPLVMGFEILNAAFDAALRRQPRLVAFGQDVGLLGDVNQGFRGLQEKYGELRVSDTGIREATIIGQAIGMAMRGLRPIAEIQYLDYLLYGLQILSDDLATLHWRTKGGQRAPVIIRTRGHRLEGVWHSGSLLAGIFNLTHGIHLLVPRNMTQAAGFYNTLLLAEEPALVIEALNGYRLRERMPANIGDFTVPLGVPEVLLAGDDVTLVTYGACCRIALESAEALKKAGISVEVLDVQSLLPFDLNGKIGESLRKTNRLLLVDEDVPGGTTAYMLQQVLERQGGYHWLDSPPRTLSGKPHRPAYGSDGDYWSKPNAETIFSAVYELMHEVNPRRYPSIY
jgi:2-oxoisovalerate dehydrogenase E1 component